MLGLGPDATDDEITDRYRSLAKVVHPDVGGDAVMFDVLSDSYSVLSNTAQKLSYDAELATIAEASASVGIPCGASRHAATVEDVFTPRANPAPWRERRSTPAQRRAAREGFSVHSTRGRSHLTPGELAGGFAMHSLIVVLLAIPSFVLLMILSQLL